MYVTAQRMSVATGRTGVNAYRHLHGDGFVWPGEPWRIPEEAPGQLVADHVTAPFAGGGIQAYLDLIAPDDANGAEIDTALTALWLALAADESGPASSAPLPNPVVYRHGRVVLRFAVEVGLARAAQFSDLRQFVDPATASWHEVARQRVAG